eukprot:364517-Chlamydomonas_euryale.AAC.7
MRVGGRGRGAARKGRMRVGGRGRGEARKGRMRVGGRGRGAAQRMRARCWSGRLFLSSGTKCTKRPTVCRSGAPEGGLRLFPVSPAARQSIISLSSGQTVRPWAAQVRVHGNGSTVSGCTAVRYPNTTTTFAECAVAALASKRLLPTWLSPRLSASRMCALSNPTTATRPHKIKHAPSQRSHQRRLRCAHAPTHMRAHTHVLRSGRTFGVDAAMYFASASVMPGSSAGVDRARACHAKNQKMPSEPNPWKTDGQPSATISCGDTDSPMIEPTNIPEYTSESDRDRSLTGTQRESMLFIAGIATPSPMPIRQRAHSSGTRPIDAATGVSAVARLHQMTPTPSTSLPP